MTLRNTRLRASETRARVKITLREKRRHAAGREKNACRLFSRRVISRALAFRSLYYPWGKMGDYS